MKNSVSRASRPASRPRVSMGMPVYNGEQFLEEALRSLLAQTFEDFELLISDNASTDRTNSICLDYASMDSRIRYWRNPVNLGYSRNQNFVIEEATGEYFLVTHCDDVRSPAYLARTLEVLDSDESIVVCYTTTQDIDQHGNYLPRKEPLLHLNSDDLRQRFRDVIRVDHICEPDFGLTRLNPLRRTRLHGDYADSDRTLLAELALHGRMYKIPECLFFRRKHALQSTAIAPGRQDRTVWFSPVYKDRLIFPAFRQYREFFRAIGRAPINWRDRAWCCAEMLRWLKSGKKYLRRDIDYAIRYVFWPICPELIREALQARSSPAPPSHVEQVPESPNPRV